MRESSRWLLAVSAFAALSIGGQYALQRPAPTTAATVEAIQPVSSGFEVIANGRVLVYICTRVTMCKNGQIFEVFDGDKPDNPIFSVAKTGGPAAFGDCLSDLYPGTVILKAVVTCYESPLAYIRQHPGSPKVCKPKSLWISPQGAFTCAGDRRWPSRGRRL